MTYSLDELFQEELGEYWIAGVRDVFVKGYEDRFKPGMMLVNVNKWRRENLSVKLIELTNQHHQEVFGDPRYSQYGIWRKLEKIGSEIQFYGWFR